jgi:hypothetical protein
MVFATTMRSAAVRGATMRCGGVGAAIAMARSVCRAMAGGVYRR